MADKLIRVGRVSKIDYETGMMAVTYPDLDDAVTSLLSVASLNDEYKMPEIGDDVLVMHLPSGQARGVVVGKYWNGENRPAKSGPKLYRKEYGHRKGEAYMEYDGGTLLLKANKIVLQTASGSISVDNIISRLASLESRVSALEGRV